ncbi:hypothetical protein V2J09_002226 [Rumex salicifolius]
MGEDLEKIVADENVGSRNLGEEGKGRAQESLGVTCVDEVECESGVVLEAIDDQLGLNLADMGWGITNRLFSPFLGCV